MTSLWIVGGAKAHALLNGGVNAQALPNGGAKAHAVQTAVFTALGVAALMAAGCGEVARTGRAPAFLIIENMQGASGADPGEFGSIVQSDVQTLIETTIGGQTITVPTIFNDLGQVTFRMALKNPGTAGAPLSPSTLNEITISRYRVVYRRSDGRSTQGVDVPYSFDGSFTVTVPANGSVTAGFDLVRHQAKREAPLSTMIGGGSAHLLSTIAEVTFFGRDQVGHEVMVVGSIGVNFADFGDPQ